MRNMLLTALGYVVIVFPLALVWHLGPLRPSYEAFGYFEGTPNVAVGLLSMVVQGATLAVLYPRFQPARAGMTRALRFCLLVGLFFWSCHVLGLVAKQEVPNAMGFIALESLYLALKYALLAGLLTLLYPANAPIRS